MNWYVRDWAIEQCLAFFSLTQGDMEFIRSAHGVEWLMERYAANPATFYEEPLSILRQEIYHAQYSGAYHHPGFWLTVPPGGVVLDYGCGTAEVPRCPWILRGGEYVGVETSSACLRYLRQKYRQGNVLFLNGPEALCPDTGDGLLCDGLLCLDVLEHVSEPLALTAMLWDTLKVRGHALWRFSDAYPHPGHLRESIVQIPAWFEWLSKRSTIIEMDTFLWTMKR